MRQLEGNGFGLSIKKRESNGQTRDAGIRSIPFGFSLLTGDGFVQHGGEFYNVLRQENHRGHAGL
jgi:hypothetical protein